ncbi:hypothetical protein Scep_003019 [Stephania cephalantha]|uniref:RRM domain-containing protein n=1 Tax=Stephania cephalantha TaxID=152367 RepID=A0AAP0Q5J1_9MAGN
MADDDERTMNRNGLAPIAEEDDCDNEEEGNPSTTSSSSSDDDSDDDQDLQLQETQQALEKLLAENPSDYDAHLNYIKLLRKRDDIDKLRQARESMAAIFPLTPSMWQEWANDEATLSTGIKAFATIEQLYERGQHDYLSVSLWCDYLNFVLKHDPSVCEFSSSGVSKMRNLFERALTAAGLHVSEGSKVWEAYIAFEETVLANVSQKNEETEKQLQRIRSIFHRQLSVPLTELSSVFHAYKSWELEHVNVPERSSEFEAPSHVTFAYHKAMEMYNARANYEEQISREGASETEKLQNFMAYLHFEASSGDPARVQILYERAITEFPISSDLWLSYARYLDQTIKVPKIVVDAYSRATRNCTWVKELWVGYLLSMERACASEKELSAVFEEALQCSFSNFDEYLDLFLTRIDGVRRRISTGMSEEDGLNYAAIREIFQRATDYLSPSLMNSEGLLHLHLYWSRLELHHAKDLVAARGVWESLLKTSGTMIEAWQHYINMEIEMGHLDEARAIYRRCYSRRFAGTGSEDICHRWLRFEREYGTLDDYDRTKKKVMPRLEELQVFRLEQESKSIAVELGSKVDLGKKSSQKRKVGGNSTDEVPATKRRKGISSEEMTTEKDASRISKEETKNEPTEEKFDRREATREDAQIKHSTAKGTYTDQCTAFISNISLQAKDGDLRYFFSDVGGVTGIRLLKDKFTGKSRGLAYVDFVDDTRLSAAVTKNKQILLGKKLSIARSDPNRNKKGGGFERRKHEHGKTNEKPNESSDATDAQDEPASSQPGSSRRQGNSVQLKGKTAFLPRTVVRNIGRSSNEQGDDTSSKSNDEFRKMLLKK